MMKSQKDTRQIIGIDAGNSRIKIALLNCGKVVYNTAIATHPVHTLAKRLSGVFDGKSPNMEPMVLISSVCQEAEEPIVEFLKCYGFSWHFLCHKDIPLPVADSIKQKEKIGVDRLISAYAGVKEFGAPCVIVSAGTAITIDLVNDHGIFAGGAIAPGFGLAARALHEFTSSLPMIKPDIPPVTCGTDTETAIKSGIYNFCNGGVKKLAYEFSSECRNDSHLILTGGDAHMIETSLNKNNDNFHLYEHLLFCGISYLYDFL